MNWWFFRVSLLIAAVAVVAITDRPNRVVAWRYLQFDIGILPLTHCNSRGRLQYKRIRAQNNLYYFNTSSYQRTNLSSQDPLLFCMQHYYNKLVGSYIITGTTTTQAKKSSSLEVFTVYSISTTWDRIMYKSIVTTKLQIETKLYQNSW